MMPTVENKRLKELHENAKKRLDPYVFCRFCYGINFRLILTSFGTIRSICIDCDVEFELSITPNSD